VDSGAFSFMSYLVAGMGVWSIGRKPSALQSAPVKTAITPRCASAGAVAMRRMRACACGERTIAAWSSPAICTSALKRPWPVSSRASSLRASGLPMVTAK